MMKTIVSKAGVVTFRHAYPDATCIKGDDIFNSLCRHPNNVSTFELKNKRARPAYELSTDLRDPRVFCASVFERRQLYQAARGPRSEEKSLSGPTYSKGCWVRDAVFFTPKIIITPTRYCSSSTLRHQLNSNTVARFNATVQVRACADMRAQPTKADYGLLLHVLAPS